MDYSQLPNPYDFANPVNDPGLFAGRRSQLDEIKYYLDHAKNASRAINVALIGSRASGKTSVLNMIEHESKKRDFRVVRVDLDESDGRSQLAFFFKLFDAALTISCIEGELGGVHGNIYSTYRTIVDTYDENVVSDNFPFIFPMQYAKAMRADNVDIPISDAAFKHDISYLKTNTIRPIIIIMDECNVLVKSRVHLEKLRNIFMNTSGFMLVLTGTEALFPLIDDVFSPIIRQFKKVSIGPFDKIEETRECVRRPLQNLDIDPFDILDTETYFDISAIHDLSSGRPYEIQLLCHLLFRRVQQGRSEKMALTSDILDEVLNELQSSKTISLRPIINKIRNLEDEQLSALGILCTCDGQATIEQIWFSQYIANGEDDWTKETLSDNMIYLKKMGVIDVDEDGLIKFRGDDFDRIYCKYYSRKREVHTSIGDLHPNSLLGLVLASIIDLSSEDVNVVDEEEFDNVDVLGVLPLFYMEDGDEIKSIKNPFDVNSQLAKTLYILNSKFQGYESYPIGTITVTSPWGKVAKLYVFEKECQLDEVQKLVDEVVVATTKRAAELGGSVENNIYKIPTVDIHVMVNKVLASKNEEVKRELFDHHVSEVFDCYLRTNEKDLALHNAETAMLFGEYGDEDDVNNLGYVLMANNRLELAQELFLRSIQLAEKNDNFYALPSYNLAILTMMENKIDEGLKILRNSKEIAEKMDVKSLICSCLFFPVVENEMLKFNEIDNPNLLETINEALAVVEKLSS